MIYVHLADGFEEVEAITVCDYLRRANIDAKFVSIKDKYVTGAHGITIESDLLFEDADYNSCQGIILPGGMPGTTNLLNHQGLRNQLLKFNNECKLIGAICAAPMILGDLGIIDNRHATIYSSMENYIQNSIYVDNTVVTDGNVITSKGPSTAVHFALKIIEVLKNKDTSDSIARDILL
ncbi:MAG: DJ-1/PfpI family protein [Anaerovoracaceae bacterium]